MGMGTELPLFFASTTRAPHLFLLLLLIFHSFNKYQLSPTTCRHCDKQGYTCSILSLPHLFPFLSFLLHASQSLFPFTSSLLPRHPPLCYFSNWNSGAEAQPPSPPQGQGAGWNHWMETVLRGPSELKVSSSVVWRPNNCIRPPHPSGLNIHTTYPYPIINQKKDRNIPPPPRYASVTYEFSGVTKLSWYIN